MPQRLVEQRQRALLASPSSDGDLARAASGTGSPAACSSSIAATRWRHASATKRCIATVDRDAERQVLLRNVRGDRVGLVAVLHRHLAAQADRAAVAVQRPAAARRTTAPRAAPAARLRSAFSTDSSP
jgi:hypothetical protein